MINLKMSTVVESRVSETTLTRVVEYVNNEFGEDVSNLHKSVELQSKLNKKKEEIETKLSIASSEVPSKLSQVLNEVDNVLKRLEQLRVLQGELDQQVSTHLARVSPIVNDLKQPIEEITYVEKYIRYLERIQMVHDYSSEIQTALLVKAELRAVTYYGCLVELHDLLSASKCKHLVNFVSVTVKFWYRLLKDKFSSEFDELLKILKWPFVPPATMESLMQPDVDVYTRFQVLFTHLLKLQCPTEQLEISSLTRPTMLLPLQLLLHPLQKRFKYHFCSKKETSKLEKPEWFFTQVLIWIREHSSFLDKKIQPILDEASCDVDSRNEFMRGLVQLVVDKLNSNVEEILYDDMLLSHTIDEALQFDRELQALGYPMHHVSCVSVLTQDPHFTRWINMERNSAVEKMDVIMSTTTAWKSRFQDQGEFDDYHVPECGENFMTLILTITDRYKSLPLPGHRLQFLDLQLELLDDFRVRLQQLHKEDAKEPLDSNYCPILNALNYIIHVLTEWGDLPFFMQMQYYKLQYEVVSQKLLLSQSAVAPASSPLNEISSTTFEDGIPLTISSSNVLLQKEALDSLEEDFSDFKLDSMTGTVFDKVIELMEHKRDDMLRNLVEYSTLEVKAKSKPYRSEKWFSMPRASEFINLSISPTACPMLMVLKAELHMLKESLASTLFDRLWQQMAEELDYFLYHEVIMRNHFNEGGAAQLHHDMSRNFFPIFGEFTRRPENYFKSVKEACTLLTLPKGSSLLLKDALSADGHSRDSLSENALLELGIYKLQRKEALAVLSLKTDLSIL